MIIPKLKPNTFMSNLKAKGVVIHLIPEFGEDIVKQLNSFSISTLNTRAILARDTVFKLGPKRVNPKAYYTKLKAHMPDTDFSHIRVVKNVPPLPSSSSLIVDYTKVSETMSYIIDKISHKVALFYLFEQISKEIKNINFELKNTKTEHMIVFSVSKKDGGMLDMLEAFRTISHSDLAVSYNNIGVGAMINVTGEHPALIQLLGFTDKHQLVPSFGAISKSRGRLPKDVKVDIKIDDPISPTKLTEPTKEIAGIIKSSNGKFDIDRVKLTRILGRVKIKNSNVASVISTFVKTEADRAAKAKETLTSEDLEHKVLQAISFSLTGDVDIKDRDPAELISRLADMGTYSEKIVLPKVKTNDIVGSLDSQTNGLEITGINRHQFEYAEVLDKSVKELFQSLSDRKDSPIEIKKITSEEMRDNKNAFKIYTVTLQNLTGGQKEPYDVKVKLPAIVNDKYLLLGGNNYMPLTQQFLKPIVKDKKNAVRFITQFNTDTMNIKNVSHNVGDYTALIKLMETKYPELLTTVTRDDFGEIIHIKFANQDEIWIKNSDTIFASDDKVIKNTNGKIVAIYDDGKDQEILTSSIIELVFDEVFKILTDAHPHEAKLNRQEPYIEIHTTGQKIPFIAWLWQKYGLLGALVKSNIDYKVTKPKEEPPVGGTVEVPLSDGGSLWLIPNSFRERLIANGLPPFFRANHFDIDPNALNDPTIINEPMRKKYKKRIIEDLNIATELMVDSTTAKVLKKEGLPTDYLEIINGPLLDTLINGEVEHPNDLKNVRARQAEVITTLIYRELSMAHGRYRQEVKKGNKEVKLNLAEDYVIRVLQGKQSDSNEDSGGAIRWIDPYSPVTELEHASEIIRTGPGGVPNQRSFRPEQRSIHPSSIGNISAHSTPEYANVGLVTHNTLEVQIDKDGFYGGKVNDTENKPFSSVSLNEALVPFQNQMNSDRLIMAVTHMSQKIPLTDPEVPIVGTGAEFIVSQLSSSKFIHLAKRDGEVIKHKKGSYITVKYDNGETETFDTNYRKSLISGQTNILLDMDTLNVGDKVKAKQAVAWTKNFKGNELSTGRNLTMAVMSHLGKNFEDGYAISRSTADKMTTDILSRFSVRINKNMKVLAISSTVGEEFGSNATILEFTYDKDRETFIEDNDLKNAEVSVRDSGRDTKKLIIPSGRLIDLKIRLNVKQGMDPTIINLFNKQTKTIESAVKALKGKLDNIDMSVLNIGGHKDRGTVFEGALLEFFIAAKTGLELGDKISGRFGTKGVITDIVDETSKGRYSGDIDVFISPLSIMGRKNTAVVKELYIGKILYHAPSIFASMAKSESMPKVKATLQKLYEILDTTSKKSNMKALNDRIKTMALPKLKTMLVNKKLRFNILFPPFTNINFKTIKAAADLLSVPLDEQVFIPELNTWTKEKVPVGINYMSAMEQRSFDKESTRSTGGRTVVTGQPTKGKSKGGGQSISEMDVYAMLNYNTPQILKELMNTRSDNIDSGEAMARSLATTGRAKLADLPDGHSDTLNLLNVYMNGMNLNTK